MTGTQWCSTCGSMWRCGERAGWGWRGGSQNHFTSSLWGNVDQLCCRVLLLSFRTQLSSCTSILHWNRPPPPSSCAWRVSANIIYDIIRKLTKVCWYWSVCSSALSFTIAAISSSGHQDPRLSVCLSVWGAREIQLINQWGMRRRAAIVCAASVCNRFLVMRALESCRGTGVCVSECV